MTDNKRPGPDPLPPELRTNHRIAVYFTDADRRRVQAAAAAEGMHDSEFCRQAVLAAIGNADRQDLDIGE